MEWNFLLVQALSGLASASSLFVMASGLTIVFGVYPKPIFDIVEPSFQAILDGAARVLGS